MPVDIKRYPPNWKDISRRIRFERAGNKCEWCGVQNGAIGARDKYGVWHDEDDIHGLNSDHGYLLFGEFPEMRRIVLTVHHIGVPKPDGSPGDPHDKMDARDENLVALCQKCHLAADMPQHIANRKKTLAAKKEARRAADGHVKLL